MKTPILLLPVFFLLYTYVTVFQIQWDNKETSATQEPINLQEENLSIQDVIPAEFEIVKTSEGPEIVYGDLDGDQIKDAAAIIARKDSKSAEGFLQEVRLIVLQGSQQEGWTPLARSGNFGGESVRYESNRKLSIHKNVLSYWHQSMRHHVEIKIRYEKQKANAFAIIGKEYRDYGNASQGPIQKSINYFTGRAEVIETRINMEKEEFESLPPIAVPVSKSLLHLEKLNEESIYRDIF